MVSEHNDLESPTPSMSDSTSTDHQQPTQSEERPVDSSEAPVETSSEDSTSGDGVPDALRSAAPSDEKTVAIMVLDMSRGETVALVNSREYLPEEAGSYAFVYADTFFPSKDDLESAFNTSRQPGEFSRFRVDHTVVDSDGVLTVTSAITQDTRTVEEECLYMGYAVYWRRID